MTAFRLPASNGYRLAALIYRPPQGAQGAIGIFLLRRHRLAYYLAPATVTSARVDADLGELGRVAVARVPTGRTRTVRWGCGRGQRKQVEVQRYEG